MLLLLTIFEKLRVMKKILIVNDHYAFSGGGDAVIRSEREVLERNGYEVFTFSIGLDESNCNENDIVYLINSSKNKKIKKFLGDRKLDQFFKNKLKEISPDLVHVHLVSKFPLSIYKYLDAYEVIQTLHGPNLFCASSWGGLKDSRPCSLGIGLKCYSNGCVSLPSSLLYVQLKIRYWTDLKNNVNLFHSPSRQLEKHANKLGIKNTKYMPLGIDKIFHSEVTKVPTKRPTLLFIGSIAEQKGIKVLVEAMKHVINEIPDVELKIAGKGHLEDWVNDKIVEYRLENNIKMLGFVDHSKIRELYLNADVFVLPSIWHEQFGLVGPEALACELPCIGSDIGGIPEWLHHEKWGYLVKPNCIKSLSSSIVKLLTNHDVRKTYGKKGREFSLREYGFTKFESNILKLIETQL